MVSHWIQLIVIRTKGIIFDASIKFHQHASEVAMKTNRALACMKRGFINLNEFVLSQLCKSMVQLILEYGNVIWDPIMCWINTGCATVCYKTGSSLRDKSYIDQMTSMNLPSLLYMHAYGDSSC